MLLHVSGNDLLSHLDLRMCCKKQDEMKDTERNDRNTRITKKLNSCLLCIKSNDVFYFQDRSLPSVQKGHVSN